MNITMTIPTSIIMQPADANTKQGNFFRVYTDPFDSRRNRPHGSTITVETDDFFVTILRFVNIEHSNDVSITLHRISFASSDF